ncbi:hypothetical protein ELE67_29465, partial [Klebsiella pneumoniae]|nr:hypothetical protein [Klebsiella pneumoniae]
SPSRAWIRFFDNAREANVDISGDIIKDIFSKLRIISPVMEITLLKPFGYCQGVIVAFSKALEYASSHKNEPIYMLGMLVHNEDAVKTISSYGV